MSWAVEFTSESKKHADKLPAKVREVLFQLTQEIEFCGPVRGDWPNYSKLSSTEHHCHLKKDKPTYVAVWREVQGKIKQVKVVYAGSHEKAPY